MTAFLCLEISLRAVETIARVTKPRNHIAMLIQFLVNRTSNNLHIVVFRCHFLQTFRRRDDAQELN